MLPHDRLRYTPPPSPGHVPVSLFKTAGWPLILGGVAEAAAVSHPRRRWTSALHCVFWVEGETCRAAGWRKNAREDVILPVQHSMLKTPVCWTMLLTGAIYAATQFWMPADGLWVLDNENKRLQVEALSTGPGVESFFSWPGETWEGAGPYHPLPLPFITPFDGKWVSLYNPLFAWISQPFYSMLGNRGIFVLPWTGCLLIFLAMAWMGRTLELTDRWTAGLILAAAGTTPIWFYGQTFWEHTLSLGLFMMGFAGVCSYLTSNSARTLWLAQLSLVAATLLREEALLLWISINGFLFLRRRIPRRLQILSAGCTAALLWGGNLFFLKLSSGAWLGHHASAIAASPAEWMVSRWESLYNLWLAVSPTAWVSVLISLPLFLLFLSNRPWQVKGQTAAGVLALAGAGLLLIQKNQGDPILNLLTTNGFFAAAPLCVFGLFALPASADSRERDIHHLAWFTAVAYGVTYTILAPAISTQGLHWGARFLLPIYLLLTLRAVHLLASLDSAEGFKLMRGLALLLALAAVTLQLHSLDLLKSRKEFSSALQVALEEETEPVWMTDRWWVGHALWSHFSSRSVYLVRSASAWEELRKELSAQGTKTALWITRPSVLTPPEAGSIRTPGMDYYTLCWYPIPLQAAP